MAEAVATIDEHPMWINLEPAYQELQGYPEAELDRKVLTVIASYANSQGIAFPLQATVAEKIGEIKMTVNRSVHRLIDKRFIKILRKEKKYNDIHPRCIYGIASDMVRETPDMCSSHFDAEKFRVIAARLKKHVSDAVDTVKKVAVDAAEKMSAKKRKRSKKARKQWQNGSYQRPYYSVENMKAAYPTVEESVRPTPKPSPVDRRIQDMLLCEKGFSATDPAFPKIGLWMLDRLTENSKPEEYESLFQEAVEKFHITLPHLSQSSADNRSHSGAVRDVRMMSHDDDPMNLGAAFGAAFA